MNPGGKVDLDSLLAESSRLGASDLLLAPGAPPTLRMNGALAPLAGEPITGDDVEAALAPRIPSDHAGRFRAGASVDFCFETGGTARVRCNLHRVRGGVAASLRLLPGAIPDIATLNLPDQIARFADLHRGFVLVVGPTGAGKSTTLASLIDRINARRAVHIVTIEDPVEFRHPHRRSLVEQIEVGADSPAFSDALRHALRQDPDVILVGEMRDLDTMAIALTAAETGHLVFSTMHTNDASMAIDRILDAFPAHQQNQIRQQLSLSLSGIAAQHLIPTADGRQRVPAVEVLVANDAIRNLIRTSKSHQIYSAIAMSRNQGMQTLEESLAGLVRRGVIAREEAFARSGRRDEMTALLR